MATTKKRKRSRTLTQLGAVATVILITLGFGLWSAMTSSGANRALTVVGIQPQNGKTLAVDANSVNELKSAPPGDILVYEVADPGAPVSLESTACSSDESLYACQGSTGQSMDHSRAIAGRLAAAAAPDRTDPYAPVRYTVSFIAAHPQLSEVTLWLNLASPHVPSDADTRDLTRMAAKAVASGEWPVNCRQISFHLVVPSTGDQRQNALGRPWWQTLIERCHGTLASYTPDWLGYGTDPWNIPPLGHGIGFTSTPAAATFTLPASVLFALNSAELSAQSTASLAVVDHEILRRYAGLPIEVLGFTDASGTPQYNEILSSERAAAVVAWLSGPGRVPVSLIRGKGLGSSDLQPTAAGSRRVEIIVGSMTLTASA